MAERTAAERVALARHPQRPNITDYINGLFTDFFEQRGDRACREDAAILGGIALFHGRPVTVIGTRKGKDLEENLNCNFGMPGPEGYRKALRLMKQAEKFHRPIFTFIDTSGAYPGLEAEERGQGEAIARNLFEMSRLTVPVIAVVTGEGNSGGALALAGITPADIGACIVATVSADTIVPSAACMLQRELGMPEDTPCFDLNAACTGFIYALHTMECLLNASPRKFGLVVGAEALSRVVDWTDRGTCILFGDGAAAAVVECREGWPAIGAVLGSRGDDRLLRLPGLGRGEPNVLSMEGTQVFKFAVETVPACMDAVLAKAGLTAEDIDFFVFHQANARIIDLAVRKYRIPPEKYYKNIDHYGNTAAASVPLVLSELYEQGRIGPGSRLLTVAFGGGLTWGGAVLELA